MWIVEKLGLSLPSRDVAPVPYYFYRSVPAVTLFAYLKNIKTNEKRVLYSDPKPERFLNNLLKIKPYGFVYDSCHLNANQDWFFVRIDPLSLKFLDYVESVDMMRLYVEDAIWPLTGEISTKFGAIDDENTLFVANLSDRFICTLFQAMCYKPEGWYGDEFYIYDRESMDFECEDLLPKLVRIVYRVRFNDVTAARRMISKAVLQGERSVKSHETPFGRDWR